MTHCARRWRARRRLPDELALPVVPAQGGLREGCDTTGDDSKRRLTERPVCAGKVPADDAAAHAGLPVLAAYTAGRRCRQTPDRSGWVGGRGQERAAVE